jgi:hypothetical protein
MINYKKYSEIRSRIDKIIFTTIFDNVKKFLKNKNLIIKERI